MPHHPRTLALGCALLACALGACGGQPEARAEAPGAAHRTRETSFVPRIPPPTVYGESAIVIDARTGGVLYAKNADQPRAVASTQKIVTCLTVMDAGSLNDPVTIQASDGACEPTKLYLKAGENYTRGQLLKALMVKSGNDVGRALARDVGGSQQGFASMMNRKARELGMRQSHFINPHGLTEPGQYSTARDIAIAARVAYRNPVIRGWTNTENYVFEYDNGRRKALKNTNKLLRRVPYCDGMKTGTTNASGRCLVSTGTLNGRSAICVVLKSNSANIWNDSERLLRWALESPARS